MNKPLCIIDRFEGVQTQWAVIEYNGNFTFSIPKSLLPKGISEGDVVEFDIYVNDEETKSRKEAIKTLTEDFFRSVPSSQ